MIQKAEKQKCPVCGLEIEDVWKTDFPDVFIARDPLEGLHVWAVYDAPKQVLCKHDNVFHVYYPGNDTHRLVYIRCELEEPEIEIDHDAICQVEGCENKGIPCVLRWFNDEIGRYQTDVDYFCQDHCFEMGFCYKCGRFWAGVEDFEFSDTRMCPECEAEPTTVNCPKVGKEIDRSECAIWNTELDCDFAQYVETGSLAFIICIHPEG